MKNSRILLMFFVALMMGFNATAEVGKDSDDPINESIRSTADSLDKALEIRNYKLAKDQLDVLFDLLKKEMKLAKKEIAELKKAGDKTEAKEKASKLKRKSEIHDRLHAMVDSSTAGLRVKAKDVKTLVREYVGLLEREDQLLSSN